MHRRQIRTWLFSVLFFSALSVTAFAEQAIVTGEEVNVRSGPGLVYSSFTSLREGMTVEVLNRSNADWYQVSWNGNVGYVSSAYLRLAEDTAPAGYDAAGQSSPGYINAMYVSLRSGPGTGYSVLGTYSNGKELTIRELSELVVKAVGFQGQVKFDASKPDGTMRKLINVDKLHSLGWTHRVEIEDGVQKLFQWYKESLKN